MIVATLPDPTVRPPSRIFVEEIRVILCDFSSFFGRFFFDMHPVSEVLGIFVIMLLSRKQIASLSITLFCHLLNQLRTTANLPRTICADGLHNLFFHINSTSNLLRIWQSIFQVQRKIDIQMIFTHTNRF